jgi:small conductance mechanosensitive channel
MEDMFSQDTLNEYLPTVITLLTNVVLAIFIIIVGLFLAKKASKGVCSIGKHYDRLDDTLFKFLGSLAKYTILVFVGIAVLNRFGVQTASIVAILGAAGLAVGLALQGALSNLAAGVMLLIFRPYKVGDFIDAAGRFGNVAEVDLFTTILTTFDNQQIIIPNSQIWGSQIINHSHHSVRGVDMRFGIAYKESTSNARDVINQVLDAHPHILKNPAPFVEVETLNNSSVDFLVRPFCEGEHYFNVLYSVPEQIKQALDAANIEIPFPHTKVILSKEEE